MLLGPVLGPVLGGLIVTNAPWQWIFYVNVPIAAVSLILAARLLNPGQGRADAGAWTGSVSCCSHRGSPPSCLAWRRPRPAAA
jgi:MFS family permease